MTKMPLSLQVIARHSSNSEEIIQSNYLDESNEMLVSEHKKLFGTMKTTKSKDKVKTKQDNMTMKLTMKKFHLVSKYANYPTWDEKQNAPTQFPTLLNF